MTTALSDLLREWWHGPSQAAVVTELKAINATLRRNESKMSALSDAADRIAADADQQVALGEAIVTVLTGVRADLAAARAEAADVPGVITALDSADAKIDAMAADLEGVLHPVIPEEPPVEPVP